MTTIRAKPTTKKASAPGNETPDTQAPVKKLRIRFTEKGQLLAQERSTITEDADLLIGLLRQMSYRINSEQAKLL